MYECWGAQQWFQMRLCSAPTLHRRPPGLPHPHLLALKQCPSLPSSFFFFLLQKALWFPFGLRLGRDSRVLKVCLVATERGFWQEP